MKITDAIEIHEKVETMRSMLVELGSSSIGNKKELEREINNKINDYCCILVLV